MFYGVCDARDVRLRLEREQEGELHQSNWYHCSKHTYPNTDVAYPRYLPWSIQSTEMVESAQRVMLVLHKMKVLQLCIVNKNSLLFGNNIKYTCIFIYNTWKKLNILKYITNWFLFIKLFFKQKNNCRVSLRIDLYWFSERDNRICVWIRSFYTSVIFVCFQSPIFNDYMNHKFLNR